MSMDTMTVWQAYSLLELDELAPIKRVKQSYRRAAKLYHPDMNASFGNTERFTKVVAAYKIIIEDRKKNPDGRSTDTPKREMEDNLSASAKRKTAKKPAVKKGPKVKSGFGTPGLLTYDELVIRFDKGPNVWVKAEAAQSLFDNFDERFESFAIPRLAKARNRTLVVLIKLLGKRGSAKALNSITPYLSSRNRNMCCYVFTALDNAGDLGADIIDKYLNTPPAILHRLTGLFFKSDLEREVLDSKLISPEKLRRLGAVERKTGLPLRDLLEGIGVSFQASA